MTEESSTSDNDQNADATVDADVLPKDDQADPSPAAEAKDDNADPSPAKDDKADPSPAEDEDKGPKSMLEAVQEAVKVKDEDQDKSSPDEKKEGEPEADAPDTDKAEAKAEEGKKGEEDEQPPFHKHPRWQEKLTEIKELTPRAEAFDVITGFMQENHLSGEELTAGFNIMALMKQDPKAALEALTPYVENLQQVLGEILPEDLSKKVEEGFMDEESAKEMARLRGAEAQSAGARQAADELSATQTHTTLVESMSSAVGKWEEHWSKTDPDYARQLQFVRARTLELGTASPPKTAEEAVQLAEKAKTEVAQELKAMLPKLKPIDDPNPPSGGPSRETTAAPTTMLEAVQAGLSKVAG